MIDLSFTKDIVTAPMLNKFKIQKITICNDTIDADEHLENYQEHMLLQNASNTTMCKSFMLAFIPL